MVVKGIVTSVALAAVAACQQGSQQQAAGGGTPPALPVGVIQAQVSPVGLSQNLPFGGTTILIMVGVGLQTVKEINSQLQQRHYEGFLS